MPVDKICAWCNSPFQRFTNPREQADVRDGKINVTLRDKTLPIRNSACVTCSHPCSIKYNTYYPKLRNAKKRVENAERHRIEAEEALKVLEEKMRADR